MMFLYTDGVATTIKDEIIDHLKSNRSASVSELAATLRVTCADIRYHLKSLMQNHMVEIVAATPGGKNLGRGRPSAHYRLTGQSRLDNYQPVVTVLLKYYYSIQNISSEKASAILADMVFSTPVKTDSTLIQRINQIIEELNRHGYDAHWEVHRDGPMVILENCPYATILPAFPQLCEMDRHFLSQKTGLPATLQQRFDSSLHRPPACIFRLKIA